MLDSAPEVMRHAAPSTGQRGAPHTSPGLAVTRRDSSAAKFIAATSPEQFERASLSKVPDDEDIEIGQPHRQAAAEATEQRLLPTRAASLLSLRHPSPRGLLRGETDRHQPGDGPAVTILAVPSARIRLPAISSRGDGSPRAGQRVDELRAPDISASAHDPSDWGARG